MHAGAIHVLGNKLIFLLTILDTCESACDLFIGGNKCLMAEVLLAPWWQ